MRRRSSKHTDWIRGALEEYERPLVHYALRLTGNLEQARDVVQDTFLKLCQQDKAELDGRLGPWLYTVCRNRAFDVRKKEQRMTLLDAQREVNLPDASPGPDSRAAANESRAIVLDYVGKLPAKQQEVFLLKFEHGMTYREICEVTGIPRSTVSHTVTQAVMTLRKRLQPIFQAETPPEGNAT